jgi:hypothetical protein
MRQIRVAEAFLQRSIAYTTRHSPFPIYIAICSYIVECVAACRARGRAGRHARTHTAGERAHTHTTYRHAHTHTDPPSASVHPVGLSVCLFVRSAPRTRSFMIHSFMCLGPLTPTFSGDRA